MNMVVELSLYHSHKTEKRFFGRVGSLPGDKSVTETREMMSEENLPLGSNAVHIRGLCHTISDTTSLSHYKFSIVRTGGRKRKK